MPDDRPPSPPSRAGPSAGRGQVLAVDVGPETDSGRGWLYDITIEFERGDPAHITLALSWVDHDDLSGGTVPPSKVAARLIEAALDVIGVDALPRRVDASTLRRRHPDVIDEARRRL